MTINWVFIFLEFRFHFFKDQTVAKDETEYTNKVKIMLLHVHTRTLLSERYVMCVYITREMQGAARTGGGCFRSVCCDSRNVSDWQRVAARSKLRPTSIGSGCFAQSLLYKHRSLILLLSLSLLSLVPSTSKTGGATVLSLAHVFVFLIILICFPFALNSPISSSSLCLFQLKF